MILIADSGSTKTDWIAIENSKEVFRTRTLGINPSILSEEELINRISNTYELASIKESITEIFFYGAGCGTPKPTKTLQSVMERFFINAKIIVAEDTLAAVYATSGNKPAIVCILGTGSNSCFFNGKTIEMLTPSLGYTIMDEASGNYFGKILLRDFYYHKMPNYIAKEFESQFNLEADFIKQNLYLKPNPNMYLASFAKFMFDFKEEKYIKRLVKNGFEKFFKFKILPYKKPIETPIYFVGSISFYFRDILEKTAKKYNLTITNVVQRPINNLVKYHTEVIKQNQ